MAKMTREGTAIYEAIIDNCYDVVKLLIEKGADVNVVAEGVGSPLMRAVRDKDKLPIIQLLVDAGARVNHARHEGHTVLMIAAADKDNERIVQYLIDKGADVHASLPQRLNARTALMIAAHLSGVSVVQTLLDAGAESADIQAQCRAGLTALYHAAAKAQCVINA